MHLHDLLLQLLGLVGGEAQLADVVAAQLLRVVVPQLRLHRERAQHGVRGEGAGQPAGHHVVPQLQTQEVAGRGERRRESETEGRRFRGQARLNDDGSLSFGAVGISEMSKESFSIHRPAIFIKSVTHSIQLPMYLSLQSATSRMG